MIIQVWSPMVTFPKNFPTPLPLVKVRCHLWHVGGPTISIETQPLRHAYIQQHIIRCQRPPRYARSVKSKRWVIEVTQANPPVGQTFENQTKCSQLFNKRVVLKNIIYRYIDQKSYLRIIESLFQHPSDLCPLNPIVFISQHHRLWLSLS